MADSHRQCIRRIGAGGGGQTQQNPDHMLDLNFFRLAVTDHGLLDHFGTVIPDGQTVLHCGDDRRPPRLAKLQGRTGIIREKNIFHCRNLRTMNLNHLVDPVEDLIQPMGKRGVRGCFYYPAGDESQLPPGGLNYPIPGYPGTGIYAQNTLHYKDKQSAATHTDSPTLLKFLHQFIIDVEIGMHTLHVIVILQTFQ